jgi:hypothetical protein
LLSAALVWHDLGTREVLGRDENATITKLDQPDLRSVLDVTAIKITGQPGNMQPLYFVIQYAFWPVVGRSAFVFRFLSSVFALLSVLLTYKLGEALFGREAGLAGAFLTSLLLLHVQYAQIARPYSLLMACALASAYFLVRALRTNRLQHWGGFVLAATLSFYTHFSALFVLASEAFYAGIWWLVELLAALRKEQSYSRLVRPALAFLLVGLLCLPGLIRLSQLVGEGGGGKIRIELTIPFFTQFLYSIGLMSPGLRGLILGFMAIGLLAILYQRKWHAALFVGLWLSLPFVILAVMKAPRPFDERYVVFVAPVALLLAGEGLASVARLAAHLGQRWGAKHVRQAVMLVLVLALAIFFLPPLQAYYTVNRKADRLEETVEIVERHVQPKDLVIVSPRFLVRPLDTKGARVLYLSDHLAPSEFQDLLSRYPRIWVLYTSFLPPVELQEPLDQWIQARGDEFARVPVKALTALAYSNEGVTDPTIRLTERIAVLQDLVTISGGSQETALRYGVLADTYDALADVYASQGEFTLADEARRHAKEARETAPGN